MKKVILIAFYFNQVNEIASKRLRALAKYLPKFGWEPIVIVPDLGFMQMMGNVFGGNSLFNFPKPEDIKPVEEDSKE